MTQQPDKTVSELADEGIAFLKTAGLWRDERSGLTLITDEFRAANPNLDIALKDAIFTTLAQRSV